MLQAQALYKELDSRRPLAAQTASNNKSAGTRSRYSATALPNNTGGEDTAARPHDTGPDDPAREEAPHDAAQAAQPGSADSLSSRPPAVHWWDQPLADQVCRCCPEPGHMPGWCQVTGHDPVSETLPRRHATTGLLNFPSVRECTLWPQGKSSVLNLSSAELTALAIGSAIFLYAAFSERRSINRCGLSICWRSERS